jgi:hypothetical protein
MSKEPRQIINAALLDAEFLAYAQVGRIHPAVESAIRADEAAKVRTSTIEECAKFCRDYALLMIGRNDTKQCGKIVFEIERAILDNHKEETS